MAEQEDLKNRQTKKVEAESVAFVVCSAFGLDTSEYSFHTSPDGAVEKK